MTEWNGNDGAPWVALQLTTFDALISPVATLSDLGDSGLGIFLPLDGTGVMAGDLDMGGNDIVDVLNLTLQGTNPRLVLNATAGVTTLEFQDNGTDQYSIETDGARIYISQGGVGTRMEITDAGNTKFRNHLGVELFNIDTALALLSVPLTQKPGAITQAASAGAVIQRWNGDGDGASRHYEWRRAASFGRLELWTIASGGAEFNVLEFHSDGSGGTIANAEMSFNNGNWVDSYNTTPPLYGGGDTFWYQQRNIRFKDTAGPPSDSEGVDGDVCLIYTF